MNESKMNKAKKGEGNFTAARHRRQITSKTVKRRELYPLAVKAVLSDFHKRREKGAKVSRLWFCHKIKSKVEEIYGSAKASSFRCSNNWFQRFKKRHHIAWRNRTNKKKDSKEDSRASIQRFHRSLRRALQTKRQQDQEAEIHPKWGIWLPTNRYNVDQVPSPFVVDQDKAYADKGSKQVWVSQPASGLEKRQTTLQLYIRASGEQTIKPAIVFREKRNITSDELAKYDKRVDVYFQDKGWMNRGEKPAIGQFLRGSLP